MSKLSFRARALDASKPMPIYIAEELPDLPDYSAINRAVPQMPSGMEKEEECEHHLQRAICAGLIIPTPEVMEIPDPALYDRLYPPDYKMPRQLIHMQPLGLEQDLPDYDMDSEDEKWLKKQQSAAGSRKCDLTELKFEETMERLERSSGQTVVTLREAKALAGKNGPAEHLLAAVYDYWLNKRLAVQQPLLLSVRTEAKPGAPSPYLAFRRRTEKMQTRKNRKNDESSYEKMVKLRRGLSQAVTLLDMMRQREKIKKEFLKMTIVILEKRYQARDFSGHMVAEVAAQRVPVPAPILATPFTSPLLHRPTVDPVNRQREKRQYKRRKHLHHSSTQQHTLHGVSGSSSSSEGETAETVPQPDPSGPFAFRRKPGCHYYMPTASFGPSDEEPWRIGCAKENTSPGDPNQRLRYSLTSLRRPTSRFIGFARRRLGRGGRVILDRLSTLDKLWESMDYTIIDSHASESTKYKKEESEKKQESCSAEAKMQVESVADKTIVSESKVEVNSDKQWCYSDVKVKCEPEESSRLSLNEQMDRIIKMEVEDSENVDFHETFNNYVTGCVSVISDNTSNVVSDNSDRVVGNNTSDNRSGPPSREECKRVSELLVQRGLGRCHTKDLGKTANEIDEMFSDCVHFRPVSPPAICGQSVSQTSTDGDLQLPLTDAQISVQVLPPLSDSSGDALFHDTSLFSTSEFTLSALYGDSLLPDVCATLDSKNDWSHTNGPEKLGIDPINETSKSTLKDTSSDSSSWNHTGAPATPEVTSNSLFTRDESNHVISMPTSITNTNGIEWSNVSNISDKVLKVDKVVPEDVKMRDKRLSSSVFTVQSLDNEKQIFLASDKNYRPVSPPQATPAPQQGIYIPISTGQTIKKKSDGQGMAVVQVRAPPMMRQVIGRPPVLVAQHVKTLPGGHKVVQGQKVVQQNQKVVQHVQKMMPGSKLVQQQIGRKIPSDTSWRLSDDQIIVSSGGGGLQSPQQMVTVAVTESLKLRLQGHLITSTPRDGIVQSSGRRAAVVQLPSNCGVSGAGSVQSVGGSQVKVVRTLTPEQRTRLLQAAGAKFSDLSGVLQLQVQARPNTSINSESVDMKNAHINDTTASSSANTSLVTQSNSSGSGNSNSNNSNSNNSVGGASVIVNTQPTSTQAASTTGGQPGGQQRKSPMEVT